MISGRLSEPELHGHNALETPPNRPRKTASRGQRELFDGGGVRVVCMEPA